MPILEKKLINEKIESDKLINTYKKNLVWATNLLKKKIQMVF